jgi:hypothetical protein
LPNPLHGDVDSGVLEIYEVLLPLGKSKDDSSECPALCFKDSNGEAGFKREMTFNLDLGWAEAIATLDSSWFPKISILAFWQDGDDNSAFYEGDVFPSCNGFLAFCLLFGSVFLVLFEGHFLIDKDDVYCSWRLSKSDDVAGLGLSELCFEEVLLGLICRENGVVCKGSGVCDSFLLAVIVHEEAISILNVVLKKAGIIVYASLHASWWRLLLPALVERRPTDDTGTS